MTYVNLLPEDYLARQAQKRANLLCSIMFCLVIAGVLAAMLVSEQSYRRTREVNERVNDSYRQAGKLIQQLQELDATKQRMVKKASMTAKLLERVPRSYLLATVTNALPRGGSLLSFKLTTKRVVTTVVRKQKTRYDEAAAKKQAQAAPKLEIKLVVKGLAATDVEVAKFIAQMARCPLLDTVDLVYSEEKGVKDALVREFEVEMVLKPDADVREVTEVAVGGGATRSPGAEGGAR
jgi:Tfp pilus assembly protein PilN